MALAWRLQNSVSSVVRSEHPLANRLSLHFGPLGQTVEFVDCPDMADGLLSILCGWTITEAAHQAPAVTFQHERGRYLWRSETRPAPDFWRRHPPRSAVEAICDFHYCFLGWYAADNPGLFCLHAAAVEFAEGLVVFPCVMRAGKSTLTAELARLGHRVYCDDVLPIQMGSHAGFSLGILPRLRRPLPPGVSSDYRAFVEARWGLSNERYVYLKLGEDELAPLGWTMPVRGVVNLERLPGYRPTKLNPLPVATALKKLIHQNFAKTIPPVAMFEDLHRLAGEARCLDLTYSDVADAAAKLIETFGSPAAQSARRMEA
jgi:hypothetical protein